MWRNIFVVVVIFEMTFTALTFVTKCKSIITHLVFVGLNIITLLFETTV